VILAPCRYSGGRVRYRRALPARRQSRDRPRLDAPRDFVGKLGNRRDQIDRPVPRNRALRHFRGLTVEAGGARSCDEPGLCADQPRSFRTAGR